MPGDAGGLGPGEHGIRGELGAVIADDELGLAAHRHERAQLSRHPLARNRGVDDGGQAFLGYVVDHVQDAQPPTGDELVVHAGALTLAAGCDDPPIDPVSDATVEAMGLHAWEEM